MIERTFPAYNNARTSANRIHDDEVARQLGFTGGLVPGVTVHAWLCWGPVQAWGRDWLERGTIDTRLRRPAYDGDDVQVSFDETTGVARVADAAGTVIADAQAALPATPPPTPDPRAFAPRPLPAVPPPASPAALAVGTELGSFDLAFPDDTARTYLADVREDHSVYGNHELAHPGWLLRLANRILSHNVRLGPWIHTSSAVQHHGTVRPGSLVSCRGRVVEEFERNGHRFCVLDLALFADSRPIAAVTHTAIYQPRQAVSA